MENPYDHITERDQWLATNAELSRQAEENRLARDIEGVAYLSGMELGDAVAKAEAHIERLRTLDEHKEGDIR